MNTSDLINFTENLLLVQKAIDYTMDGISIADCSKPDMPLIYVNKGFETMTGYTADEVIGTNCRFLQGPDNDQPELKIIRDAITNGTECDVVLKNYTKDGVLFYNELKISPIKNAEGTVTHFVGIQSNVTERVINEQVAKSLTQELSESNIELQNLNLQIQEMQSIAVHDIKNPLSSIMSSLEILEIMIERDKLTKDDLLKRLKIMETSSKRMLNIITDFLETKKISSGNVEIFLENIDLNLKVKTILKNSKDHSNLKGISFDVKIGGDANYIFADRSAVIAILDNLISNAVKYSPLNTTIHIQTIAQDDSVIFEITDEGKGIPEKDLPKLFKQFEKMSNKPTGSESSSGLGLYIVKKYCDLINSEIRYEKREGTGATFILKFPKAHIKN